jgi:hypothetical protein
MGQERHMPPGTAWALKPYRRYTETWDHDHCEFCQAKFIEAGTESEWEGDGHAHVTRGYAINDEHPKGADYYWVCEPCFADFAAEYGWRIASAGD